MEYGRKTIFSSNGWYAEPQGQMTLGRIGVQAGRGIDQDTHAYAEVNLLHKFAGDLSVYMNDGSDELYQKTGLSDTWVEYGVGADIRLGQYNRMYIDVAKSAGGDFKKKWQWMIGFRWMF